jgi:hypothetical protein
MTLTIAARWRVTFRVQSLARMTMPAIPPRAPRQPDLLAIAQAERLHNEMETMRDEWRCEALLSFRRMF